jgi:hypothetical protein
MRHFLSTAAMIALFSLASFARAEDAKSGLATGEAIGPFDVVKCAGAEDDGVKIGSSLCYRCRYGNRPMVMVFTHNNDKGLPKLIKELNTAAEENKSKQLKAFVNVVGDDKEKAETAAKTLGKESKLVPVVVPVEYESGPKDYGINPKVETTVIVASGGKVVANHALGKDGLTEKAIATILADVTKKALK